MKLFNNVCLKFILRCSKKINRAQKQKDCQRKKYFRSKFKNVVYYLVAPGFKEMPVYPAL